MEPPPDRSSDRASQNTEKGEVSAKWKAETRHWSENQGNQNIVKEKKPPKEPRDPGWETRKGKIRKKKKSKGGGTDATLKRKH